jgi:hypothetical protein
VHYCSEGLAKYSYIVRINVMCVESTDTWVQLMRTLLLEQAYIMTHKHVQFKLLEAYDHIPYMSISRIIC